MKAGESSGSEFNIDEIIKYAEIKHRVAPDAGKTRQDAETPQCTDTPQCVECNCPKSQPEEADSDNSVCLQTGAQSKPDPEEEKQEEAPDAGEIQQCPGCTKLQPEEEVKSYCECSSPLAGKLGNSASPDQVLAQYNSRPPVLISRNSGGPGAATAPIISPPTGRPSYSAPKR